PRALAHLRLRERRRPAGAHRQRRHDAPQPRPPRRGPRACHGSEPHPRAAGLLRPGDGPDDQLVAPRGGGRLDPPRRGRGRRAARRPAGHDHGIDPEAASRPGGSMTDTQTAGRTRSKWTDKAVYAAGAVVWRVVDGKLRVLLIHRTKYRDVTLPKGKVDPGEMLAETAVREIFEETGIRVALGVPVGVSRYRMANRKQKVVHYWAAEATEEAIRASAFVPNREIAAIEWMSLKKARKALSYPVDVEILDAFEGLVEDGIRETCPGIVRRHAKAQPRADWEGTDASRPLTPRGQAQAEAIVGPLRAFGVRKIVTSDAVRCRRTVRPLARALGIKS